MSIVGGVQEAKTKFSPDWQLVSIRFNNNTPGLINTRSQGNCLLPSYFVRSFDCCHMDVCVKMAFSAMLL